MSTKQQRRNATGASIGTGAWVPRRGAVRGNAITTVRDKDGRIQTIRRDRSTGSFTSPTSTLALHKGALEYAEVLKRLAKK